MHILKQLIMLLALLLASPAGAEQDVRLLKRLQVDVEALRSAEQDFQRHQEQGETGANEIREYAAYVDRLRQRVARDCMALAAAEVAVPADLDCPAQPSSSAGPAAIDQQAEQTDAERAAALDAELNADLGEYDERLLREQERVKAAKPRTEDGEGGQGGAGSAAGGEPGGDLAERGDKSGTSEVPPPPSGAAGGPGHRTTVKDQPADVGDGSGDDVVARQLREAAEKETDPELRKKLWEEYRKYKKGAG
ncbi:MAG: hypothetical protein GWP20_01885 [Thermotogales bacterium]|nr:hypothetical protein [Thermotogales bacterium]